MGNVTFEQVSALLYFAYEGLPWVRVSTCIPTSKLRLVDHRLRRVIHHDPYSIKKK